jgi:hypothetical protein
VVNRAIADMATTINEIIQYKYDGNSLGSTIASPLAPLFDNEDDKQIVIINRINWVMVPLYDIKNDISITDDEELGDTDDMTGTTLKNVMSRYIDSVYDQYEEMTNFLLKEEAVEKEILTEEETKNE